MPVGNGRIGIMMRSGAGKEQLQINEDTLTSGEPPADLRTIDITKDFAAVTKHLTVCNPARRSLRLLEKTSFSGLTFRLGRYQAKAGFILITGRNFY